MRPEEFFYKLNSNVLFLQVGHMSSGYSSPGDTQHAVITSIHYFIIERKGHQFLQFLFDMKHLGILYGVLGVWECIEASSYGQITWVFPP